MEHHDNVQIAHSLRWFGHTDRGRIRKNNEDSFLGLQFDANDLY